MTVQKVSRRELLRMLAAGSAVLLIPACRYVGNGEPIPEAVSPTGTSASSAVGDATAIPNLPAEATVAPAATATSAPSVWSQPLETRLTPNDEFYVMKFHPSPPPEVDLASYRLEIVGEVDNPLSLSMDEIKAFSPRSEMRTLECISNPVGGALIGNANWVGAALADILASAGLRSGGRYLKLESLDGYHTGIPVDLALDEHSLLVYEMNGETLPARHGYPLRALWPGRYGQKQPKWLERITVQRQSHIGHFEGAGWSDDAIILPNARIEQPPERVLQPAEFVIAGIAMTNDEGLEKVEVSIDNGGSWAEAELLRGPSTRAWTHWWLPVSGLTSGAYRVLVRVTDNQGRAQSSPGRNSSLLEGTFPNGTDEMHRVVVQVKTG